MIAIRILTATGLLFCSMLTHAAANECRSVGGLEFVCGLKNAEDLALVPGTPWIVASGMDTGAGIALIDSRTGKWSELYPGKRPQSRPDPLFAACAQPPDTTTWQTHGLHIRASARGRATLYVVAHGARESIEVFDVDATRSKPTLTWKGCVTMPNGLAANSVASFADGSLVATVLLMPGKSFADSVAKRPTGAVYEWSPGAPGFVLVSGSELPGNNGIETSADGSEIFVVSSGYQTVVTFTHSNPTRRVRITRPLPFTPDNVHMDANGKLITAGMKNDVPECGGAPGPQHDLSKLASCPRGTVAVSIDPKTMKDTLLVETPANADFSNATMLLPVGKRFWIGTFSGDRVAHGALP